MRFSAAKSTGAAIVLGVLLSLRAHAAAPVIFKTLDPVGPDETALLYGDSVTPQATGQGVRLDDERVSAPPREAISDVKEAARAVQVEQATDLSAKLLIPSDWKPGVYAVRVKNGDGVSDWQFLNRPEIWWLVCGLGGNAEPGGDVRVCGLNFGVKSRVWLQPQQGEAQELAVRDARENDLTVTVPKDVPPGHYRIWVHNGFGGEAGFGEAKNLAVVAATPWPDQKFDVKKYGAKGDGKTDDTKALGDALAAAQATGGGVVWIPRGTYIVTGKLVVPGHTIVRGESRELVWLKGPSKAAPFDAVLAGDGNFGVENLSIVGQTVKRRACPATRSAAYSRSRAAWGSSDPNIGNVRLRNLRLEHLVFAHRLNPTDPRRFLTTGGSTVVLRGPDCVVADCTIISSGMPIQIENALRAQILRNQFGTGRQGWYGLWNFQYGIFEGNEIQGRDLEGSYGGVQGTARFLLFRDNYWHDAYGDEREALTFDSPYGPQWIGTVTMNGPTDLALGTMNYGTWPQPANNDNLLAAVIVAGKGLGQLIPLIAMTPAGATLESPWKVAPDANSVVALVVDKSNCIVTDNRFCDTSAGPQLYAQSYSFIISHNKSERTGGSYADAWNAIDSKGRQRLSYAFFNQWLDNEYDHGFTYDQGGYLTGFLGISADRGPNVLPTVTAIGNRFENNLLDDMTAMGVDSHHRHPPTDPVVSRDAIFENNSWTDLPVKIGIGEGNAYTLLRDNRNDATQAVIDDHGTQTVTVQRGGK